MLMCNLGRHVRLCVRPRILILFKVYMYLFLRFPCFKFSKVLKKIMFLWIKWIMERCYLHLWWYFLFFVQHLFDLYHTNLFNDVHGKKSEEDETKCLIKFEWEEVFTLDKKSRSDSQDFSWPICCLGQRPQVGLACHPPTYTCLWEIILWPTWIGVSTQWPSWHCSVGNFFANKDMWILLIWLCQVLAFLLLFEL